jgi:hypothetical protein
MDFYKSDNYKQQQAENIPMLLEQMKGSNSNPTPNAPQAAESNSSAPSANASIKDAIAQIKSDGYIQ